jgi:hypothetical protein
VRPTLRGVPSVQTRPPLEQLRLNDSTALAPYWFVRVSHLPPERFPQMSQFVVDVRLAVQCAAHLFA